MPTPRLISESAFLELLNVYQEAVLATWKSWLELTLTIPQSFLFFSEDRLWDFLRLWICNHKPVFQFVGTDA